MVFGLKVDFVLETPLVMRNSTKGVKKAKDAIKAIKQISAFLNAKKVKDSHVI